MAEIPLYVPDASITGAWYLRGERFDPIARIILRDYRQDRIRFIAPSHIWYEVPSLISRGVGGGRISLAAAQEAVPTFFDLRIPVFHSPELIHAGFEYSIQLQCSLYDAVYLALADLVESPFIYADEWLRRTLRDRHPRALWIEDYQPS